MEEVWYAPNTDAAIAGLGGHLTCLDPSAGSEDKPEPEVETESPPKPRYKRSK